MKTRNDIRLKKGVNKYTIYETLLNAALAELKNSDLQHSSAVNNLETFVQLILQISKYMLEDRFIPSKPARKARRRRSINKSRDLILFEHGEIQAKPKASNIEPLHMIAALKCMENFLLRRKWLKSTNEFNIGRFDAILVQLFNILPKLILEIDSITDVAFKTKMLNLLFSSIIIYRQFKVKTQPSADTMHSPYNGSEPLSSLKTGDFSVKEITTWLNSLDLDIDELNEYSKLSIYSGNASSPNGGASSSNILKDVAAVSQDKELFDAVKKLASNFEGNKEFLLLLETLALNVSVDKDFLKDTIHSRLFHFTAPGGKSRVIANVDWTSQTALSAIHFTLFKLLSIQRADCTFDHKSGIKLHDQKSDKFNSYYSIDLSAATDRMPRKLQAQLISAIWTKLGYDGSAIAENWLRVVDREYDTSKSKINNGLPVRYAVGQGMGLFSSWVAMAITHHYITNHLCRIPQDRYRLVGDDLLILGTRSEFEAYLTIMKKIGLNVNLDKTITSEEKVEHNIEFARNYIISGCKITPLPFGQLYAWVAEACPLETSISIIIDCWQVSTLHSMLDQLCTLPIKKCVELSYFLYAKKGVPWNKLPWLPEIEVTKGFGWVTASNFDKVAEIMLTKEGAASAEYSSNEHRRSFLDTLRSQCTMRNIQDILRSKELSTSILLLQYADDRLTEAANLFHERLVNAYVLTYDVDELGTPLLSKRERRLLDDIFKLFAKNSK
jgi:hypothetical protein